MSRHEKLLVLMCTVRLTELLNNRIELGPNMNKQTTIDFVGGKGGREFFTCIHFCFVLRYRF